MAAVLCGATIAALFAAGVPHRVQQAGSMFSVFFVPDERQVRDFTDARTQDTAAFTAFFHEMLARGVYLPPSAYESWFVSAALDDEAVQRVLDALPAAARAAAAADPAEAPPAEVAKDAQELSP